MTSTDIVTTYDDTEHRKEVTFSPPLYRQRYDLAASILQEAKVTSVCLIVFFYKSKDAATWLKSEICY